jgi:hypothetical protein
MKKLVIGAIALMAMIIVGCGGGATEFDAPEIIQVVMTDTEVEITWEEDTAMEGDEDFDGYNVYVVAIDDSSDLLVDDGEDLNKDNATPITGQVYTITGLSQDTAYAIQVRTVNIDDVVGGYNVDVPFVLASPRPGFTATVKFEIGAGADADCAIRFMDATLLSDAQMADSGADMWVDAWTSPNYDTVAFDSPSHHSEYGTGANVSMLVNIGQYGFDDIWEVTTEPSDTTFVPVEEGDLVLLKTADDHYVKIHVDVVDRTLHEVTITYGYQNLENFPYFMQ